MQHFYKILVSLILWITIIGCSNEDEQQIKLANEGIYKVHSIESSAAIDLDYDGIASTDFKEELNLLWFDKDPSLIPQDHLEIRNYLGSDTNEFAFLMEGIPRDGYHPLQSSLDFRFKFGDYIKTITVDGDIVTSINFDMPQDPFDPNLLRGTPIPTEVIFNDENTVTVYIDQGFYDHLIDDWVDVELVAIFKKQ